MFITIEGVDGSGKSTQAGKLAQWLEDFTERRTVLTFEPGGWDGGKALREFILWNGGYSAMSELLLFLVDRSEHVNRVILPALREGHNVICERYNDSTLAYQAGGHGLDISQVREIIGACGFPEPDVKILLDIDPETALSRIRSRRPDRFEAEGSVLMKKVAEFYRTQDFTAVIDCNGQNEQEIFTAITGRIRELWQSR